ncbi:MAG: zf-TFIIB domain-containing protein [Planctomycetota bacterium]
MAKRRRKPLRPRPPKPHANEAVRPGSERSCPVCAEVLVPGDRFQVHFEYCEAHGVWLDDGELEQLLRWTTAGAKVRRRELLRKAKTRGRMSGLFLGLMAFFEPSVPRMPRLPRVVGQPHRRGDDTSAEDTRACPVCDATMRTQPLDDVRVDVCAWHGMWFDDQELNRILARAKRRRTRKAHLAATKEAKKGAVEGHFYGVLSLLND